MIVCGNIHTVCRGCCTNLQGMPNAKCPQCRTELWKQEVVNRDLIFFMAKLHLPCGSCVSNIKMNCTTAFNHSRECSENHVPCPLLNNDTTLSRCNQSMSISNLWQHCLQYHVDANSSGTTMIDAIDTRLHSSQNSSQTATISVPICLDKNSYTYFSIRTKYCTYNMCMHVSSICHSESEPRNIVVCFRRFFPEVVLSFEKMLMSVEIGDLCGLLVQIPAVVSAYEDMSSLTNLPRGQRLRKIIEIQPSLLKQMNMDFTGTANDDEDESSTLSSTPMMISAQFFFTEMASETNCAPIIDDTQPIAGEESLSKKRKQADEG